jgi:hypothetical protein
MASNLLSLNPSKTEFLLIDLPKQLSYISLLTLPYRLYLLHACNLDVIFDSNSTSVSDCISAFCKSAFSHVHNMREVHSYLSQHTAVTTATIHIHFRRECQHSISLNLPASQLNHI